jgi:hypothetical protein
MLNVQVAVQLKAILVVLFAEPGQMMDAPIQQYVHLVSMK